MTATIKQCDVCIVGTGAAGGILAYRLAMAGISVLSLEQGAAITDRYFTNELNPEGEPHFGITPDMPWDFDPSVGGFYVNVLASSSTSFPKTCRAEASITRALAA